MSYQNSEDSLSDFSLDLEASTRFEDTSSTNNWSPKLLILCTVSAGLLLALKSTTTSISTPPRLSFEESTDTYDDNFLFTVKRIGYDDPLNHFQTEKYINNSGLKYAFLDEYDGVLEPNIRMSLVPKSSSFAYSATYKYSISVRDRSDEILVENGVYSLSDPDSNTYFYVKCSPYEKYTLTLKEYNARGELAATTKGSFLCMNVRRDISSLSTDDFTSVMEAMNTLWTVSDEEGQSLYGSDFHSAAYFAAAHDFNTAWMDSDHMGEGMGFIAQHQKLTSLFEKALRSVDPSVSLPYWDYTLEASQGKTVGESVMFTEKAFGTLSKPSSPYWGFTYREDNILDGRIKNGRWKDAKMETYRYESLKSAFGYLRGPWDTNPSPYISRFSSYSSTLPTCSDFVSLASTQSFSEFLFQIESSPHILARKSIGSVFGCDSLDSFTQSGLLSDTDSQVKLCGQWPTILKSLYRDNYFKFLSKCSVSDESSMTKQDINCGFTCSTKNYDSLLSALEVQLDGFVPSDTDEDDYKTWRKFICDGEAYRLVAGDQLMTGSPIDPSFWPMFPTLERFFHAKLLSGGFSDLSWVNEQNASETSGVCSHSTCYEDSTSSSAAYDSSCCYGHYSDSKLFDYETGTRSLQIGYSNQEQFTMSDPTSIEYSAEYIFDSFDWSHCSTLDGSSEINALFGVFSQDSIDNLIEEEEEAEAKAIEEAERLVEIQAALAANITNVSVNFTNVSST